MEQIQEDPLERESLAWLSLFASEANGGYPRGSQKPYADFKSSRASGAVPGRKHR